MANPSGTSERAPEVVKHPGCPQWGLGLLVEERDDKRFYEFEDGQAHSIAKPFWSKLEPVRLPEDERAALEAKLRGQRSKPPPSKKARVRTAPTATITFDEQVARFEKEFAGGFAGDIWTKEERGVAEKKGKAFKSFAIATAQSELAKGVLEPLLAAGDAAGVIARVRAVHAAAGGLLHPLGDVIPFSKIEAEHQPALAEAIVGLLHGSGDFAPRFDRFMAVLNEVKVSTWPLATVLTALFDPTTHVFVKPSFYEKQAAIIGKNLGYERVPTAAVYGRMVEVAAEVESRLRERGHTPKDRLDVYAFIWRTVSAPKVPKPKKGDPKRDTQVFDSDPPPPPAATS